jgi:membrane protein YdbS with pleckstrin-like domain
MQIEKLIKKKPNEKLLYVLRRHPLTFVPQTLLFLLLLAVPLIVFFISHDMHTQFVEHEVVFPIIILAGASYYCIILLFYYSQFIDFYLDIWVVTTERIVDVEQLGLFARTISELDLFRVEDATTEVKGLFPTILNYGTVYIKTASMNSQIIFHDVREPNKVRETIVQRSDEERHHHQDLS